MLDNRCLNSNNGGCNCAARFCVMRVLAILTILLAFVVGVIVGAFVCKLVLYSLVPIVIFALILFIAIALILFYSVCRCRTNVD